MTVRHETPKCIYETPQSAWLLIGLALLIAAGGFHVGLQQMIGVWLGREEYSHGVLIPLLAAFLIWQRKDVLERIEFAGSWSGVAVVAGGGLLHVVGTLATLYALQQYALLVVLYGLVLALGGWRVFRLLAVPLAILLFMIPLPEFILQNFSSQLQLISSQIGVWFIRLFGISVFVEGNVIDLGGYKLQVAEACDGLRYLFPLMTLGFIMAYFFKAATWKRLVLFASSVPITILMNSFRIGTIGVLVEHWGVGMAEGFLHDFQGWAVFMTSAALLLAEMIVLARIGRDRRPWREVFGLEFPAPTPRGAVRTRRSVPRSFVASVVVLVVVAIGVVMRPERAEAVPEREAFYSFPAQVETWTGRRSTLEQIYLDALKLDDYVIADYIRGGKDVVNFYVAWYDSQRAGQSAHSPRSCLPGGGWRIASLDQVTLPDAHIAGVPLRVNRVQIELGAQKQLVYYWFQQRGRVVTNEYLVKWYLFWDSLTRRRTDGALVRLVTPLRTGEAAADADARLTQFAAGVVPRLERYIPD
jgi:exosortase D (VPLPA-CTERM-specific)